MPGIRSKWLHRSVGEIQSVTGLIQLREDDGIATARTLVSHLPDPRTPVEERLLRGLLLDVSTLWAVTAHQRAHGGTVVACGFRDEVLLYRAWHVHRGHAWSAKRVFLLWATQYFRGLRRAHPVPVQMVATWITAHSRERVTDAIAARSVGIHVAELRKRFRSVYGMSVHDYVQRVRLLHVMRLLADGRHNVRSALFTSGWRSAKSVYAASIGVTGVPFDQLRAMPRDEWEFLLAQCCPAMVA